jgi:hypothetical protein
MIAALLALLSSSAGGAITGFIKRMMDGRAEAKEREAEHVRLREMRGDERLEELYMASLKSEQEQRTPVTLRNRKTITLGNWSYEKETQTQRLPIPFRTRYGGFLLGLLIATYCTVVLALVNAGSLPIATFDPQSTQGGFGILWGLFDYRPGKSAVATLSSAGLAVWMLSPIVFIMSAWIVGATPVRSK